MKRRNAGVAIGGCDDSTVVVWEFEIGLIGCLGAVLVVNRRIKVCFYLKEDR